MKSAYLPHRCEGHSHKSLYGLQKEYRKDLETEIRGKGMEISTELPEIQRARKASQLASQVSGEAWCPAALQTA